MVAFRKLVSELDQGVGRRVAAYGRILQSSDRVIPYLADALRRARTADAREACADLLGARKKARAVPALIEALGDEDEHVHVHAMWAIEKALKFEIGGLQVILGGHLFDGPRVMKAAVTNWWKRNRSFIEGNWMIW